MSGHPNHETREGPARRRPLRAIGYVRVSTSGQAERGMGLDTQRQAVRQAAESNGFELLETVQETASGAVRGGSLFSWEHRPELLKLLERAKEREFDVLLVARFDRLSRDHASLTILERMLQPRGVQVVSAAEGNGDEPIARLLRSTLAGFAEYERDLIRERIAAGKAQAKLTGRHTHGSIAYGYRSAGQGRLDVDEAQAEVVRTIFRLSAKEGLGARRIAARLNEARTPSPRGKAWTAPVVARILANPLYRGERYGVKNAQPAIVTTRLWNAAQRGRVA